MAASAVFPAAAATGGPLGSQWTAGVPALPCPGPGKAVAFGSRGRRSGSRPAENLPGLAEASFLPAEVPGRAPFFVNPEVDLAALCREKPGNLIGEFII